MVADGSGCVRGGQVKANPRCDNFLIWNAIKTHGKRFEAWPASCCCNVADGQEQGKKWTGVSDHDYILQRMESLPMD